MAEAPLTALVTGSGRNIGRAIALDLAARGMRVVVHGHRHRDSAEETAAAVRAAGSEALVAMGDLGERSEVGAIAAQAIAAFGGVDVLVNNAAIRPESPLEDLAEADWHHVFAVNLHSAFVLTQAFVGGMKKKRYGRIVYFTGMNAMHGYAGRPHVSASKHALWGLTKSLAKELGPSGITVNAVSPGPISTEHPDDPGMARHIASLVGRVPLGRLGTPQEVAALCGFLCSKEGGYVSGQMIACNGAGQT